jgi:malate dehydrogenase (oxaloacetate-decarboxylating)
MSKSAQHPDRAELMARAHVPAEEALRLHPVYRGKIETSLKCPVESYGDFSIWYTPGVAAPSREISQRPERVFAHTNKGNTIAIVTDGSRVLGLGDIGPEAALPVMEGKALLFKYLGGVDAVHICLRTRDPDEIIRTVELLEPSFGGINLEDIAQPKCFRILDELRARLSIPVWHDDQQGTATAVLAALVSALELVGKALEDANIVLVGCGAANVSVHRLLRRAGAAAPRIVVCDSKGPLHPGRSDIEAAQDEYPDKWAICRESNGRGVTSGLADALTGADVCIAFSQSGPDIIAPAWIRGMARDAIVFACANPVPEIWPWDAYGAGARVVATGRGDFPNQINNSLVFPGLFRGALDVQAASISEEMSLAAAQAIIACTKLRGLAFDRIVPTMDDLDLVVRIAVATAAAAVEQGIARAPATSAAVEVQARATVDRARRAARLSIEAGIVPARRDR